MPRDGYFNLVNLPELAQLRVAAAMDVAPLVFMSFVSSKTKKMVREVMHDVSLHLEFTLHANRSTLSLCDSQKKEHVTFEWKRFERGEEMTPQNLKISEKRRLVIQPTCPPIVVREYLEDLFGYPTVLYFYVEKCTAFNLRFVQLVGHILCLIISGEGVIPAREARRLFNFYGRPIHNVSILTPQLTFPEDHLLYHSLDLTYLEATKHQLRFFRGRRGFYMDCSCEEEDLIYFIRRWLESGDTNLQEVFVIQAGISGTWNPNIILNQFETTAWDPNVRAGTFINPSKMKSVCSEVDFRTGRDVLRADGKLATIEVSSSMFYFVVWHQRFPSVPTDGRA